MTDETIPRRKFLVGAGVAGTAVATAMASGAAAPAPQPQNAAPAAAQQRSPRLHRNRYGGSHGH
jgi:hypothetical protein